MRSCYSYRITYTKVGIARYIGHLDLQNLFHRSLRRAGLKARYSEGFNPHPIISFASPLSVGMEGLAELADIDLAEFVTTGEFREKLNSALPTGLTVTRCEESQGQKKAASLLRKAAYDITVAAEDGTAPDLEQAARDFMSSDTEARALVYELKVRGNAVQAVIACGGSGNLKPSALAEALCGLAGVSLCGYTTWYCRRELIF